MKHSSDDARATLSAHQLAPKKSFGQNFLRAEWAHQRIVAALNIAPGDAVIELGAGLGALTEVLAATQGNIWAVERDRDLVPIVREKLAHCTNVTILEADAKAIDYAAMKAAHAADVPLHVIGNIPYQLTSPILFSLLAARRHVSHVALLVQKEVALRLCAPAGNKTYGLLSVLLGAVTQVQYVATVARGCFFPAPRVDSAIVSWQFKSEAIYEAHHVSEAAFTALVKQCFQHRRKMIRAILGDHLGFASINLTGTERPESLTPLQFVQLTALFVNASTSKET